MNSDSEGLFWQRMNEILRLVTKENDVDTGIYVFIATLFKLINPVGKHTLEINYCLYI